MILARIGINAVNGLQGLRGLIASNGITTTGGGGVSPPVFDGIYWNSSLINNGLDSVYGGVTFNENTDPKNPILSTGIGFTPPLTLSAFPDHIVNGSAFGGTLSENEAETLITTDMSSWDSLLDSVVVYDASSKVNNWTFTGGLDQHWAYDNSTVTLGTTYTHVAEILEGSSRYIQLTPSGGFPSGLYANFDLQTLNTFVSDPSITARIYSISDGVRIELSLEADSTSTQSRIIMAKIDDLTDGRLPNASDEGQYLVRYPNYIPALQASSPIDAPLSPVTRASDKIGLPTSNAWIDTEHGLSGSGTISLAGTKYDGALDANCVGTLFSDGITITAEITGFAANSITVTGAVSVTDIMGFNYSDYDLQGIKDLKQSVGDLPTSRQDIDILYASSDPSAVVNGNIVTITNAPGDTTNLVSLTPDKTVRFGDFIVLDLEVSNYSGSSLSAFGEDITGNGRKQVIYKNTLEIPAGSTVDEFVLYAFGGGSTSATVNIRSLYVYSWLDFPTVGADFEFNFVPKTEEPSEIFHIEWANAAKDTYFGRNGTSYNFVNGNDTLSISTSLITPGQLYKGNAVITDTELIFYLDDIERGRITRTDTQTPQWSPIYYLGGFETTLTSQVINGVVVKDFVPPAPLPDFANNGDFADNGDFALGV